MANASTVQVPGITFTETSHNDTYPFVDPIKSTLPPNSTVLITGASRGIGLATAISYAKAGAVKIGITARAAPPAATIDAIKAAAKSASKPEPEVLSLPLDVTSSDSITECAAKVRSSYGKLDILINNAGYLETFIPIVDSDPDEWWKTMTVNLRGPYLLCRAFIPLVLESDLKTVVNVSSIGAIRNRPGASGYQTSKSALLRVTEFADLEYAEKGLVCFAIHPGGVLTDLAKVMPAHTHSFLIDTPELAGDSLVWLTQERREWLGGRYVSVNWDMQEFEKEKKRIVDGDLLKMRMTV